MIQQNFNTFENQVYDFCIHVAGSCAITALSIVDDQTLGLTNKSTTQILLVLKEFPPRLMIYPKLVEGKDIVVLAVDQGLFERDVTHGFLGEAASTELLFSYKALVNPSYLHQQEVLLKKRLILELLENITLSFPELSYQLYIKAEYFLYEVMLNRVRVFPPLAHRVSNFLCGKVNKEKLNSLLEGYVEALRELEKEEVLHFKNGYVLLSKNFIDSTKRPKILLTQLSKNASRVIFSSALGVFPQILNFLSQTTQLSKLPLSSWKSIVDKKRCFVDPQKYVFVPTAQGLVSLADRLDIKAFAEQFFANNGYQHVKVEEFGGVLNDLFIIKAYKEDSEKKIIVKRFKDWSSFKWFPLFIWSLGARNFAVLGASRLERECAISEFLAREGFNVPKLLHVNHKERLLFMEFVEGRALVSNIKHVAAAKNQTVIQKDLQLISRLGEIYAKIHSLEVVLGDTKPENTLVTPQGELVLLDFEQASHRGDKSWDVAEFLYFAGHYLSFNGEQKANAIAYAFIKGYLTAGGAVNTIKHAGLTKYTRVFSIFTLPNILRVMASACKNA
ncbi:MAG: RIO1 family regulatory kinase/ATPase [Candidatus Bathyarchaeia archaeon]